MTMKPMMGICPVCKRKAGYNPSVGKMYCPRCLEKGRKILLMRIPEPVGYTRKMGWGFKW